MTTRPGFVMHSVRLMCFPDPIDGKPNRLAYVGGCSCGWRAPVRAVGPWARKRAIRAFGVHQAEMQARASSATEAA